MKYFSRQLQADLVQRTMGVKGIQFKLSPNITFERLWAFTIIYSVQVSSQARDIKIFIYRGIFSADSDAGNCHPRFLPAKAVQMTDSDIGPKIDWKSHVHLLKWQQRRSLRLSKRIQKQSFQANKRNKKLSMSQNTTPPQLTTKQGPKQWHKSESYLTLLRNRFLVTHLALLSQ